MKVLMHPSPGSFGEHESGIRRVIEAYDKYLPRYDIEIVGLEDEFDIVVVHAGTWKTTKIDVAMTHGLYWTADYKTDAWLWRANSHVISSIRHAKEVTVPSSWVAETFQRDMRFSPHVLGHGIDLEEWADNDEQDMGFVLWNKNRGGVDVCDPYPVSYLAGRFENIPFVTTFSRDAPPKNVRVTGLLPHKDMRQAIKQCGLYLATTKETFGIGTLEAMAAGKPILGFAHGGILDMVQHGVNGYLARPGDYDDLANGLLYCAKNAKTLGTNSRQLATEFTWPKAVEKVAGVFRLAAETKPPLVDIVIPVYNKPPEEVQRAVDSALSQTMYLGKVIVVDDGSTEHDYSFVDPRVYFYKKENGGVATARNFGISKGSAHYAVCLDADDWLDHRFLEACVPALEEDLSLGIAYTGLWYTKPDGEEGLSQWPDDFDFDAQLRKKNQVPTACVFRRKMWQRLGGYKQRYAPQGAGTEDAEFWLRSGAYGWGAKKVTAAGLFKYSWLSGQVTGNPDYKEVDWLSMHPWTKDDQHPFASVASPKSFSHPVRQYDEPSVSIIIPVGQGHEDSLLNALDSLESQTFRRWEAVVVNDTGNELSLEPYPYAKVINTDGEIGAGAARNLGVKHARASLVLFLDADDYLTPPALEHMLYAWNKHGDAVYSDYVGRAMVKDVTKLTPEMQGRMISYDGTEAIVAHRAHDYDCVRASRQPENPPYIWCNITTLIPKEWHNEIGGFDESMPSWEDIDYWYRMAWSGKCFRRIPEQLLVYKFYTGKRRERGLHMWEKLIEYIAKKKEHIKIMGCGCKDAKGPVPPAPRVEKNNMNTTSIQDDQMVMARYLSPNKGQHGVRGQSTSQFYGYRAGGETFLVHVDDLAVQPHLFDIVDTNQTLNVPTPEPEPLPEPVVWEKPIREGLDLQLIPGITPAIAGRMEKVGLTTKEKILEADEAGLKLIEGIGVRKAKIIIEYLDGAD